jgi:hypothetical protein
MCKWGNVRFEKFKVQSSRFKVKSIIFFGGMNGKEKASSFFWMKQLLSNIGKHHD